MPFKVISFDMFQTLVDVNARKYEVWKEILKENYSDEKAEMYWQDTLRRFHHYAEDRLNNKAPFQPMLNKFTECYSRLFEENNIQMDVTAAVRVLFREHGKAVVYHDAVDFLSQLAPKYRIWISSDTDREMIRPLLSLFKHEYALISEDIGAYKQDEHGLFFKHVLHLTGVNPKEILHVGDGISDIVGAKRAGIAACWINREGKKWTHPMLPDYTITSLMELSNILNAGDL